MLDMQWVKQRFESTRKAATDDADRDTDAHQVKRPDPRPVYSRVKFDDLPSICTEPECVNA
jgi:hypothetical protein